MKKLLINSFLLIGVTYLFTACDTNQSADQMLKSDAKRGEIIALFSSNQPYRMELMNAMLENDSNRTFMGQKMMENPEMMEGMMKDPTKLSGTMKQMVHMADSDSAVFNAMIIMMKDKPKMWDKIKKINGSGSK